MRDAVEHIRRISGGIASGGFIGLAIGRHPLLDAVFSDMPYFRVIFGFIGVCMFCLVHWPPKWLAPK
jgi:F0F1-type ATP synthase assembly protein I